MVHFCVTIDLFNVHPMLKYDMSGGIDTHCN